MFLPFLSGLAQGAADTYEKNADEDRKQKAANNKLVADSIFKRLETDDTLKPSEQTSMLQQGLKMRGVDNKTIDTIVQHSDYFRNKIAQQNQGAATTSAQGAMANPAPLTDQTPTPQGIGDVPTQGRSTQQNASLAPPIPQFQEQTAGQINLPQQIQKASALAEATAKTATDEKLRLQQAQDDYQSQKADQFEKDYAAGKISLDQLNRRYEIIGLPAPPRTGTGTATYLPAPMNGKDLKDRMTAEGKPQGDIDAIDPTGLYRVSLDPTKTKIQGTFKMVPNTYQGKAATGSNFVNQFPKDALGNDTDPNMIYYPVLSRTGGAPTGIMPETLINTESVKNNFKTVTQPDGSTVLVPVIETTQTSKTPAGSTTPASPLPTAPASLTGEAPPVTPTPSVAPPGTQPKPKRGAPTPATPLPTAGVTGPGTVVGGRPMTPELKQKNEQQAEQLNNTIGVIKDLKSQLPTLANMLSTGKIALQIDPQQGFFKGIINRSMPMTEAEKNVAANWQLLTESVLQMRIPMGGAGFRGPEGFGAIESNKGILTQNPDIINRVLSGTLREFKAQRDPMVSNAKKYGYNVQPEMEHGPAPTVYSATGPNGHKITSTDGKNWVDAVTGAPVK